MRFSTKHIRILWPGRIVKEQTKIEISLLDKQMITILQDNL